MGAITVAAAGWEAGKNAIGLVKVVLETAKSLGKAEVVEQLTNVQVAMMDLISKQFDLIQENQALQMQLREAEAKLQTQGRLEYAHNAYWMRREDGTLDGPFSPPLWDKNRQLVRMQEEGCGDYNGHDNCYCYICKESKREAFVPAEFVATHGVCRPPCVGKPTIPSGA
jgi:hypothetical protein